jgi:hypothetical protein
MNKMKTTLAASVALAACLGTQAFAQTYVKEGTISFALTGQEQTSVSETTAANAGNWVDTSTEYGPTHYKTGTIKLTQANLIQDIAYILHGSASYYGSSAKLVLVQGELSGFFVMTPDLSNSVPSTYTTDPTDYTGTNASADTDSTTVIGDSTDSLYAALATGRHFETNPITGQYPIGHLQPWGQIYVKYIHKSGSTTYVDYENATEFFGLTVQECYDCFYLNSFISDATFTYKSISHAQSGPPCCSVPTSTELIGAGKDRYYLTLSFDDTVNNPYLNKSSALYSGYEGITPTVGGADGILPDVIVYDNAIKSNLGKPSPYETRFTLNGIVSYGWTLKFVNSSDAYADFIGSASYTANGYGFIQLYCALLSGTASIVETAVKPAAAEYSTPYDFSWNEWWFSTGDYNDIADTDSAVALNQNVYFNWYGFTPSTPFNTGANLSYHANFNEDYTSFVTQHSYAPTTTATAGVEVK